MLMGTIFVSYFTTPSKPIAVLSLAGLGDMPLHLHRTMRWSSSSVQNYVI
ncbi:hypothetical protein NMYAN_260006 [Nitrosomonas nitrosa]|uniref:Uncharacterized protein n=1 Tax=Nitrosomonas nitrosa TaxID=52442 RepID=A0A8H8Z157_9PROT|nr:hypothetical protein NMYAN_260006 [Nitrosomonas nitrosa]